MEIAGTENLTQFVRLLWEGPPSNSCFKAEIIYRFIEFQCSTLIHSELRIFTVAKCREQVHKGQSWWG